MTTAANTTAGARWQKLLLQLALSVPELAIAGGLGFAVFWGTTAVGCRALYPVCDSTGGLAIVVVALVVGILVASGYWVLALALGLGGQRRARYGLDAVALVVAVGTYAGLMWRDHSEQAAYRAAAETAARNEAADREAWIAALRQNPDGHGPPVSTGPRGGLAIYALTEPALLHEGGPSGRFVGLDGE